MRTAKSHDTRAKHARCLFIESANLRANVVDILFLKRGVNRQGKYFSRGLLALREIAGAIPEIAEAFLHVKRERVINIGAHAILLEMRLQPIALRSTNHELIVNMPRLVRRRRRQPD